MKILSVCFILPLLFASPASAQLFPACPAAHVISFKEGTGCSASSYSMHTINLITGDISSTAFYTHPNVNQEINGIGINSNDNTLYGMLYDRSAICTFSNFNLFRLKADGTMEILGALLPPTDNATVGYVEGAFGAVTLSGDYIFRANITIGGTTYLKIGKVNNLQSLTASATITPNYYSISQSFTGRTFADWAIHPISGDLYTYTIDQTTGNGQVAKLDLESRTFSLVGAETTGVFLDPVRDNFGGVMFGSDNFLYGVDVFTRNFYRIDPFSGAITLVNNIPSLLGGQLRIDMGSCTNGLLPLAVKMNSFSVQDMENLHHVSFISSSENNVASILVEQSTDGKNYTTAGSWLPKNNNLGNEYSLNFSKPSSPKVFYRIKVLDNSKSAFYSNIIQMNSDVQSAKNIFTAIGQGAIHNTINFRTNLTFSGNYTLKLRDLSGKEVLSKQINLSSGVGYFTIELPINVDGMMIATLSGNRLLLNARFICSH